MGHGGASGYLAVMALVGLSPIVMKPTALVLNIVVATIAMARYGKAGAFDWGALWPFLVGSVPLTVFGGAVHLPGNIYKPVVGIILLIAAIRLLWPTKGKAAPTAGANGLPIPPAVVSGAGIGFLSGLTGTGGGIFLSPLLLFTGWLDPRRAVPLNWPLRIALAMGLVVGVAETATPFVRRSRAVWSSSPPSTNFSGDP